MNLEVLGEGLVSYAGGTVQAELRELCAIAPISYAFARVPDQYANDCIPKKLASQGYKTVAMHAAHSGMYARDKWYPTIGFQESYFYNKPLANVRKCKGFPGFCDVDLLPSVVDQIADSERILFYWMTLNSHIPYDPGDLSKRDESSCAQLGIVDSSRCNQFLLIKDLFDHLAGALANSKLSGLEILLVGDHNPPFITFKSDTTHNLGVLEPESRAFDKQFVAGKVPYLHLRVR